MCRIIRVLVDENAPFGGTHFTYTSVGPGAKIESLFKAGGAYGHQMLILNNSSPVSPKVRWQGTRSSPGEQHKNYFATLRFKNNTPQTNTYRVILSALFSYENERIGVMHNTTLDSDNDGLSDPVEYELGTCAKTFDIVGGYICGYSIPNQDTDNDGLSDYAEVVGEATILCNGSNGECHYNDTAPLPLWGSDPLHKDVFIEVDWDGKNRNNQLEHFPFEYPLGDPNHENSYFFNDDWSNIIHNLYQAGSASDLRNPGGAPGVRIHFDITDSKVKSFPGTNPMFIFNGEGSTQIPVVTNCTAEYRLDLKLTEQSPLRSQFMHYLCISEHGSGGQASAFGTRAASSGTNAYSVAHELGHNIGLSHEGGNRYNGSPLYKSQMNYAYSYNPSIGFSTGELDTIYVNPTALSEVNGLGIDNTFLGEPPWNYNLFSGNGVDWNNNGVLDSGTVRAAVTWAPHAGTNAQLENSDTLKSPKLSGTPHLKQTPSLIRVPAENGHGELLYVLYRSGTDSAYELMHYNHISVNADGSCINDPFGDSWCGSWSTPKDLLIIPQAFSATGGVDLTRNITEVYIALVGPLGSFSIHRATPKPDGSLGSLVTMKQFSGIAVKGTPTIASSLGALHIVWRDQNDNLWEAAFHYWNQNWVGPSQIGTYTSSNDPTLLHNYADGFDNYLSFADENYKIQILQSNFLGLLGYWSPSLTHNASAYKTRLKIGLAWQPYDSIAAPLGSGFLTLGYVSIGEHGDKEARLVYFQATGRREGYLGNQWTFPDAGIEFLGYPGDANIKASFHNLATDKHGNPVAQLHYYPIADGIFDYDLTDSNDFKTMRTGICGAFDLEYGRPCNGPGFPSLPLALSQTESVTCPGL